MRACTHENIYMPPPSGGGAPWRVRKSPPANRQGASSGPWLRRRARSSPPTAPRPRCTTHRPPTLPLSRISQALRSSLRHMYMCMCCGVSLHVLLHGACFRFRPRVPIGARAPNGEHLPSAVHILCECVDACVGGRVRRPGV